MGGCMLLRMFFLLITCTSLSAYELSILAMFRDESRYLKEWVEYHRLVGVEHFFLYNDHSVDNWQEVLKDYIDEGLVEVIDWLSDGDTYGYTRQPAIYRDGIQRAMGKTKWLAIIDIDEFVVPMKEQTITECINKYYPDADAIYINWRNFGTGGITVPEGQSILYHLTACSLSNHSDNKVGKCIIKPEVIVTETLWTPHHFDLIPGLQYFNGNGKPIAKIDGNSEFGQIHCDKFLRINHYVMRDEFFFWNYRHPRQLKIGNIDVLMEHYESFSISKDMAIRRFCK